MGARQAVELVERRAIAAGADAASLASDYEERHLPVQVAASAGHVDEIVEPADTRVRLAEVLT
jgi:acetyl-CoA carboxylase carboxyltransferase component